jgi:Streptomyces sporulation and cell division protein, SsgA
MKSSRTEVSAELGLGLVGPEHTIVPLMASLHYCCTDPYAIRMAFHVGTDEPVEWTLARDLLAAALHSREGIGDVQAWPSAASCDPAAAGGAAAGDTILNIAMTSPFGAARFEVSAQAIADFLQRTYKLVPAGHEPGHLDFDAELTELLSQALPTRGCHGRANGPAVGACGRVWRYHGAFG